MLQVKISSYKLKLQVTCKNYKLQAKMREIEKVYGNFFFVFFWRTLGKPRLPWREVKSEKLTRRLLIAEREDPVEVGQWQAHPPHHPDVQEGGQKWTKCKMMNFKCKICQTECDSDKKYFSHILRKRIVARRKASTYKAAKQGQSLMVRMVSFSWVFS